MSLTLFTYLHLAPVITTAWDLCCEAIHKQSKVYHPYNYFKEYYSSLNKHFQETDWSLRFEGYDIDHNYSLFVQIASSAIIRQVENHQGHSDNQNLCPTKSIIRSAQSTCESKLIQCSQTHPRVLYHYNKEKKTK